MSGWSRRRANLPVISLMSLFAASRLCSATYAQMFSKSSLAAAATLTQASLFPRSILSFLSLPMISPEKTSSSASVSTRLKRPCCMSSTPRIISCAELPFPSPVLCRVILPASDLFIYEFFKLVRKRDSHDSPHCHSSTWMSNPYEDFTSVKFVAHTDKSGISNVRIKLLSCGLALGRPLVDEKSPVHHGNSCGGSLHRQGVDWPYGYRCYLHFDGARPTHS